MSLNLNSLCTWMTGSSCVYQFMTRQTSNGATWWTCLCKMLLLLLLLLLLLPKTGFSLYLCLFSYRKNYDGELGCNVGCRWLLHSSYACRDVMEYSDNHNMRRNSDILSSPFTLARLINKQGGRRMKWPWLFGGRLIEYWKQEVTQYISLYSADISLPAFSRDRERTELNQSKAKQIEWSTTKSADPSPRGLRLDILWVASKEMVVVSSGQGFFTIILRPICNGSSEKYSSQFGFISN